MTDLQLLQELSFGQQVAEQEARDLGRYFVSTYDWERVIKGQIDIVYGPKGSGKSAIYVALTDKTLELEQVHRTYLILAENVRGDAVFKENLRDLPASEEDFRFLWKLYFLALTVSRLMEKGVAHRELEQIALILKKSNLIPKETSRLAGFLKPIADYVKWILHPESLEVGSREGVAVTITLREPSHQEIAEGHVAIESIYGRLNAVLAELDIKVWIALDRLDVAFVDHPLIEEAALRALFRVYLDMAAFDRVSLKLFLRTDIWQQITRKGFREASHITRTLTLEWNERNLLHLIAIRIASNETIANHFNLDPIAIKSDSGQQADAFYCIVPDSIERGTDRRNTFSWILRRIQDSNGVYTPRDMIKLLSEARDYQIRDIETGRKSSVAGNLISPTAIREAWESVSKWHLEKHIYAEYADCRDWLERLRGKGIIWKKSALMSVWNVDEVEYEKRAARLSEIGFWTFKNGESREYHIPYLFRPALGLVQRREE